MVRYLSLASAMATAASTFLLAYPGDLVPQSVLLVCGVTAATLAAGAAFFNSPAPPANPAL